ncbi:2OG-Fe(II) oxygenase [Acinetobacter dispersus]|uniref:2OG-Fe(II) oxygenase n=1 Tax=Acinetobacter dispersus TaxID=70348 RepID=UPI0021CDBDE5|nr:2OG-Fe(II) oxygenase [Acinetobacter dispersus]MCU4338420.1 2OG-Fe(II) oxygenase [Acinetobacter dispersus]
MQATTLPPALNLQSLNLDQVLDNLNEFGFALIDDIYSLDYVQILANECTSHLAEFRAAGIQNGVVSHIRSDHILWIDAQQPIAQQHLQTLEHLSQALNQAFYLGIKEVEAHFACYNAGEFYALHRDNPQQKNDRMMSTVFYLHESWQEDWGGQLRLQDKLGQWHIIQPQPNRLAIFQSDVLHEVLLSKQQRLSITAWLRSGGSIWNG